MQRSAVIRPIIDLFDSSRYLEIGVPTGTTFHALHAKTKVAVDPKFQFDFTDSADVTYHQCPSDAFFANYGVGRSFYIDGLHTYEQTL